ncbi:MAG: hypothetical protein AAFN77_17070 [Planctomycetota bacterium]
MSHKNRRHKAPNMIEVKYQLTDEEIKTISVKNECVPFSVTKIYSLFLLILIPGVVFALIMSDLISLATHGIVFLLILMGALISYLSGQQKTEPPEMTVTFDEDRRCESSGESRHQIRLKEISDWEESPFFFELNRFGIYSFEPKRAYTPDQQQLLRSYLTNARGEAAESTQALPLFEEMANRENASRIRYMLNREDFVNYQRGGFRMIDPNNVETLERLGRAGNARISLLVILSMIGFAYTMWWFADPLQALKTTISAGTSAGLFIWVLRYISTHHKFSSFLKRITNDLFEREVEFGILDDGWYVGNENSVSFHHWNDVNGFSISKSSWLISTKTNNHLIPLRIFGSQEDAERAILTALIKKQHFFQTTDWGNEETVTAVESGNPFQAPNTNIR